MSFPTIRPNRETSSKWPHKYNQNQLNWPKQSQGNERTKFVLSLELIDFTLECPSGRLLGKYLDLCVVIVGVNVQQGLEFQMKPSWMSRCEFSVITITKYIAVR